MRRLDPNSLAFTFLLGSLGALPPLAIDMSLPSLGQIGREFGVSDARAAWTLSAFMAGFALAQLVFGPISEKYGRRPVLLAGLALFSLASFVAALSPSFSALLVARFVEAAGAGGGFAMTFAIIRDTYEGPRARTMLAYIAMVMHVAPVVAPTLGAAVLAIAPWPAIYLFLGVASLAQLALMYFGLRESHPSPEPEALSPSRLVSAYATVLRTPAAVGNALIVAAVFGCLFAYISGSANLMMGALGLSPFAYAITFALSSGAIIVGTFLSSLVSRRHLPATIPLWSGLVIAVLASLAMLAVVAAHLVTLTFVLPLVMLASMGFGLVAPNAAHGAMHPLPQLAGVMGATLGFLQMTGGSISSGAVAHFDDGSGAGSMAAAMTVASLLAIALYAFWVRPAERRAA